MRKLVILAAAVATCAVVVAAPASAGPATLPTYSVSGIETGVPQNEVSSFAGVATTRANAGVWSASVAHDSLSGCTTTSESCSITGGSFSLSTVRGRITGTFTGGTIVPRTTVTGCTNQQYDVDGSLSTSAGPATFQVVLTHFQARLLGRCVTYFATVSGSFGP